MKHFAPSRLSPHRRHLENPLTIHQQTIKKGDSASLSIAAASIIAKVSRDRLMADFDRQYPGYGFAEHKGYGCAAHMAAIAGLAPV